MSSTAETFPSESAGPFAGGRPSQSFNSHSSSSYGPNFAPSRADSGVPLLELPAPLSSRSPSRDSPGTDEDEAVSPRSARGGVPQGPNMAMPRSMTTSSAGMSSLDSRASVGGPDGPFTDQHGRSYSPSGGGGGDLSSSSQSHLRDEWEPSSPLGQQSSSHGHGVSLVDNGFLPPGQQDRVRRVARNSARRQSGSGVPQAPVVSSPSHLTSPCLWGA